VKQDGTYSGGSLCESMEKDQREDDPPKDEKPGMKEQKEAAKQQTESPGQPARGE
jgi:hypothetical protein